MSNARSPRIAFETPPGKLGLVYELLAEYGATIVDRHKRCFTLEFQRMDDAGNFFRDLFEHPVRLRERPGQT